MRGQFHLDRWEWLNPKALVWGDAAVLAYNFVGYAQGNESRWNCTEVYGRAGSVWRIIQTHWSITQPEA